MSAGWGSSPTSPPSLGRPILPCIGLIVKTRDRVRKKRGKVHDKAKIYYWFPNGQAAHSAFLHYGKTKRWRESGKDTRDTHVNAYAPVMHELHQHSCNIHAIFK